MPRTEIQYEEIRRQKMNLIMQTALELFASEGYFPTSISRIAEKAGISKGLMYNYFESKEELVKAIIFRGLDELNATIDPDRDGIITEEEFEFLVNENFRMVMENANYWKFYFATMMQPSVFKLISERLNLFISSAKILAEDYYRRKKAEDPAAEAALFLATLDGVFLDYFLDPKGFPLEGVRMRIIERFR